MLAEVVEPYGGAWTEDGWIVVADNQGGELAWFPESGGRAAKRVSSLGSNRSPRVMPDGRSILMQVDVEPALLAIAPGDSGARPRRWLNRRGAPPDTTQPEDPLHGIVGIVHRSGHLLYGSPSNSVVLAVPFDVERFRVEGVPTPVLEGVRIESSGMQVSMAATGLIAFAPGENSRAGRLVWADSGGALDTLALPRAVYGQPAIAPDGYRLATAVLISDEVSELRVYDLSDASGRVLHQWRMDELPRLSFQPDWMPDGSGILAGANPRLKLSFDGRVDSIGVLRAASRVTSDGRHLIGLAGDATTEGSRTAHDVGIERLGAAGRDTIILPRPGQQLFWRPSPDVRMLAYTSSETGRWEVWVEPFPPTGERRRVSVAGGEEPIWSPQSDRLYYRYVDSWYVAGVNTRTGEVGTPVRFISGPFLNVAGFSYDVSPDGQRLLLIHGPAARTGNEIRFIRGFDRVLRQATSRASAPVRN